MNPERSFALAAATVVTLLLASASLLEKTISSFREAEKIFADTTMQMRPMLKCLGIAAASRLGADLCRDASQSALASAVETAGNLCAAALAMPLIISLMTTIGGML
jgi:stage III sporulation protein AD